MNPLHELQSRSVEATLGSALDRVTRCLSPGEARTVDPTELAPLAVETASAIERVREEARDG